MVVFRYTKYNLGGHVFTHRVVKRQGCLVGKPTMPGNLTSNAIPVLPFLKGKIIAVLE